MEARQRWEAEALCRSEHHFDGRLPSASAGVRALPGRSPRQPERQSAGKPLGGTWQGPPVVRRGAGRHRADGARALQGMSGGTRWWTSSGQGGSRSRIGCICMAYGSQAAPCRDKKGIHGAGWSLALGTRGSRRRNSRKPWPSSPTTMPAARSTKTGPGGSAKFLGLRFVGRALWTRLRRKFCRLRLATKKPGRGTLQEGKKGVVTDTHTHTHTHTEQKQICK